MSLADVQYYTSTCPFATSVSELAYVPMRCAVTVYHVHDRAEASPNHRLLQYKVYQECERSPLIAGGCCGTRSAPKPRA
eukprot:1570047-Rhodomonas_salina.1